MGKMKFTIAIFDLKYKTLIIYVLIDQFIDNKIVNIIIDKFISTFSKALYYFKNLS